MDHDRLEAENLKWIRLTLTADTTAGSPTASSQTWSKTVKNVNIRVQLIFEQSLYWKWAKMAKITTTRRVIYLMPYRKQKSKD